MEIRIRQRRKSQRQREKIFSVASRLIWQKGYMATSIEEIAKAANVNKATIYYYFKDKVTILYEIASKSIQELTDIAVPIMDSNLSPDQKLKELVITQLHWQLSHLGPTGIGDLERRNLTPKMFRSYVGMRDEYESIYRKILKEGMAKGQIRSMDPNLASRFILGFLSSILRWYRPSGELTLEQIAAEAWNFISHALISHEE